MGMSKSKLALGGVAALIALMIAPAAQAEDFLSALFGAFGVHRPQPPAPPLPYTGEESTVFPPESPGPHPRVSYGGGQA